jgi:hypothetical protein
MTPEQIQEALQFKQLDDSYNAERDKILAAMARAYAAMVEATSHYAVLNSRITSGDMSASPQMVQKHTIMQAAMAGQDEVIQSQFLDTIKTMEAAQVAVFEATGGRFVKGVPLPAPPEEPEDNDA